MYYCSVLKAHARIIHARITQSRITVFFFVFTLFYCLAQSILLSFLLSADLEYGNLVSNIVKAGDIPPRNFTFLQGQKGNLQLQICDDIPIPGRTYPCTTVYNTSTGDPIGPAKTGLNRQTFVLNSWEKGLDVTTINNLSHPTKVIGVQIKTLDNQIVILYERCIQTLVYPSQMLQNLSNEDIVGIGLQFWLLVLSFFVILHDSVPHTLAALITRALETGWAIYAVSRGPSVQANFQELISDPVTPCSLELFMAFWKLRHIYEITNLILSTTGLIIFSYLSWKLLKVYNAQSFKCVGAPQHVMHIYKFFMSLLVTLQLELFVLVSSLGLWSKALTGTAATLVAAHTPVYKVFFYISIILLLPWIAMGWYSIRGEMKSAMVVFIAMAFIITGGWTIILHIMISKWMILQWPYLACYTISSLVLVVTSIILGIVCRINFGKGLAQYLYAEAALSSLNFSPDSFSHDTTTSSRMDGHLSRELDMKILDLEDQSHLGQVFIIPSLLKDGSVGDRQEVQPSITRIPL